MVEVKPSVDPDLDFSKKIVEIGGEGLYKCFQCATCSGSCPPGRVSQFRVRRLIRQAQFGLKDQLLPTADPWMCTQCFRCYERCPRDVNIPDVILTLRRMIVEEGMAPTGINSISKTIVDDYNPLGMGHDDRLDWIDFRKKWNRRLMGRIKDEDEIKKLRYVELSQEDLIREKAETIYFVGCNSSYPRINMGIPDAMVHILHEVGENFTLLGLDEWCCGDPLFLSGHESFFKKLAEHNIEAIAERGATKLVLSCAGCYRVFKHEYPKFLGETPSFEVIHASELLDQYFQEGLLDAPETSDTSLKITYHDPCEIGRVGRVFEAPRRVLESLGIPLIEMAEDREASFCCGGGGLVKVTEPEISSELAATRIRQAEDVGAEVITSGCPSCRTTIRDGVLSLGKRISVLDITEFVAQQLSLLPPQRR